MTSVIYNVNKAQHLKRVALTHRQKVKSLYKEALKVIRFDTPDVLESREKACELRKRFDDNKDVKDFRLAKKLLQDGQQELLVNGMCEQVNFTYSPHGTAYQQSPTANDVLLDYWHPYEKAMYPYYFARREERKQEYIKLFESEFGDAEKLIGVEQKIDYADFMENFDKNLGTKSTENK